MKQRLFLLLVFILLFLHNRTDRTYIRAGSALDAGLRIDHALAVSLGNAGRRTFAHASAAAKTFVSNLISHT